MKKYYILSLIIFMFTGICAAVSSPDRLSLGNAPSIVYKEIFDYLEKKDYSKLTNSLSQQVCLACDEIEARYKFNIKEDIAQKLKQSDYEGLRISMVKLVYFDTKNILFSIDAKNTDDIAMLNDWLKSAYSNYVILSPDIQAKNMVVDWKLRKMFIMLFSKLSSSGYTEKKVDLNADTKTAVKDITSKIDSALSEAFPEFN